ncbi:NADPH-dependent FMN reductase [Nocardia jinanensis]|uniref:NADPH-dependent FMN reductase n=1 Tax=Nocardia jinanensis TaxID=382504 RepID=UPI000738C536|nr:NADPH-dependent FMN reductase [Nocardia jinanensis]
MTVVLLVSGSTRVGSTNSTALRTVRAVAPDGVEARWYGGLAELPAFVPDAAEPAHPAVLDLRRQLAAADAVLFCTPEYAGTLPGSLKNLLDWTVGTGDLYGKPVAWLTVVATGRGTGATAALASVLGYLGADVDEAICARLPLSRTDIGEDGLVASPEFRAGAADVVRRLVGHRRSFDNGRIDDGIR